MISERLSTAAKSFKSAAPSVVDTRTTVASRPMQYSWSALGPRPEQRRARWQTSSPRIAPAMWARSWRCQSQTPMVDGAGPCFVETERPMEQASRQNRQWWPSQMAGDFFPGGVSASPCVKHGISGDGSRPLLTPCRACCATDSCAENFAPDRPSLAPVGI